MKTILVIDDADFRHTWFHRMLDPLGHEVRYAWDAEQGLDHCQKTRFDLAFFDHDLGAGLNGSQLARTLIEDPNRYLTPKCVWVHSVNRIGAKNIESDFRAAQVPVFVRDIARCFARPKHFVVTMQALLAGEPFRTGDRRRS